MNPELITLSHRYSNKPLPQLQRELIGWIDLHNIKFANNIRDSDVDYDLNLLYNERVIKPDIVDPKLENLLKFLQEHDTLLNCDFPVNLDSSKFICYRGLMTTVSSTPYERKEPWKIAVMLFKGNIYLCLRDTEEKLKRQQNITDEERKNTASGHKFEQFVFSESPDTEPNPDEPCDETKEFNCVFRTKLNKHTIIFGAEMDGVACDKRKVELPPKGATFEENKQYLQQLEFVEAKTNLDFDLHHGVKRTFEWFKSGKWWCQSFLVGINRIICGFKNRKRIVKKLKVYTLDEIENMSSWETNVCINFLDSFLTYVKECLECVIRRKFGSKALNNLQDLDLVTLLLEWKPPGNVRMSSNWNHADDVILTDSFRNSFETSSNRQKIEETSKDEIERSNRDDNLYGHSSYRGTRGRFYEGSRGDMKRSREDEHLYGHSSNRGTRGRFYEGSRGEMKRSREDEHLYGHSSNRGTRGRFYEGSRGERERSGENEHLYGQSSNSGNRGGLYEGSRDERERSGENEHLYGQSSNSGNRGGLYEGSRDERERSREDEHLYGISRHRGNRRNKNRRRPNRHYPY